VQGFVNLNKPGGFTSHDCVARVRRLLRQKRIGHGGTLDPAATGVLPIAVGRATRLIQFLPGGKAYRAMVRFGVQTTTDDLEGDVIQTYSAEGLSLEQIEAVLPKFLGEIEQIPPKYSAIQLDGKRLYDLARAGVAVEVPVRTVKVHSIEVLGWYPAAFPELEVAIACGSGTYIRAIARDLGAAVGTGATLSKLIRTESSRFSLDDSLTLDELETQLSNQTFQFIPLDRPLQGLPPHTLEPQLARRWCQGQKLSADGLSFPLETPLRILGESDEFLGVGRLQVRDEQQVLAPWVVLA
jgi:tRNA pseudouridine55 synthase